MYASYDSYFYWFACIQYIWESYLDVRQLCKLAGSSTIQLNNDNVNDGSVGSESSEPGLSEKPKKPKVDVANWMMAQVKNSSRNIAALNSDIDPSLFYDARDLERARAYSLDKIYFSLVSSFFHFLVQMSIIYFAILPYLWSISLIITEYIQSNIFRVQWLHPEILPSCIFALVLVLINMVESMPFSVFQTFYLEAKHGFNKQSATIFVTDLLKGLFLFMVLGLPFLSLFFSLILWMGESFVFSAWLFMGSFQVFIMIIYPTLLQPLFNRVKPLEEGSLKDSIRALAQRVNFPLSNLFVIDGSKRSAHSNAYFYGFFGKKRIVLYDTLLEHATEEEIVAILGHEIGHWKYFHTLLMFTWSQLHLLIFFYFLSSWLNVSPFYEAFSFGGYDNSATPILKGGNSPFLFPLIIGFILFQNIYTPIEALLSFLTNVMSRRAEFQADAYAVQLGHGDKLASGLVKLQLENLGNMSPDSWYSAYHYSHPPLMERLLAIRRCLFLHTKKSD